MGIGAVLTATVAILSARRNYTRHVDTMACAGVLLGIWFYSMLMETALPPPPPPPYLPGPGRWLDSLIDGLGAAFVIWRLHPRIEVWKLALLAFLLMSILADGAFSAWVILNHKTTWGLLYAKALVSNVLYWLSLAAVVSGGAGDVPVLARIWRLPGRDGHPRGAHRSTVDMP